MVYMLKNTLASVESAFRTSLRKRWIQLILGFSAATILTLLVLAVLGVDPTLEQAVFALGFTPSGELVQASLATQQFYNELRTTLGLYFWPVYCVALQIGGLLLVIELVVLDQLVTRLRLPFAR